MAAEPIESKSETARVEAFSDGVFAIAITLLVLEISVEPESFDHLWRARSPTSGRRTSRT